MSGLFFALMLLALLLLITGLIKPALVVRWGQAASRKQAALVYGLLTVVFFIVFASSVDKPPARDAANKPAEPPAQTADATPAPVPATGPTPEQKAVTKFQIDLLYTSRGIDTAQERFQKTAQAVDAGQANLADMLRAAQAAEDACDRVYRDIQKLEVPEDLNDAAEEACEQAKSKLLTAMIDRGQAYDAFQDYLDDRKPSQQKEFEDEIAFSLAGMQQARDELDKARQAVGLTSIAVLFATPEFKAWREHTNGHQAIMLEANRKFGTASNLTMEQLQEREATRRAYVDPKYQELAQTHYGAAGLDRDAIEARARDEQWMLLLREYPS